MSFSTPRQYYIDTSKERLWLVDNMILIRIMMNNKVLTDHD